MNVWQKQLSDDIHLVGVRGRLDQELTPTLEAELLSLIEEGHYYLVVDLAGAEYINSGGLRCLVTAWRQAREKGGNLVLSGLNSRLKEIFTMVGFDKVFQIYPTPEAAQKALKAA
ncbi:MAG: STAS domain-containing protein [Chloroflexi bacterium]|nr:STAS domain-containing protein [Chloroflexota bacterium]MCI0576210.1 STAS domain-containing protein [Chloroflexota bacterium]MCI0645496.1 STAS domain-containing protein [Chloroflexota bacterium]MCI0730635.1 STAS domain-containing protein [Chloroflexota bacterium]